MAFDHTRINGQGQNALGAIIDVGEPLRQRWAHTASGLDGVREFGGMGRAQYNHWHGWIARLLLGNRYANGRVGIDKAAGLAPDSANGGGYVGLIGARGCETTADFVERSSRQREAAGL